MKARPRPQGPLEHGVAALHHRRLACRLEAFAHELAREGYLTLPLQQADKGPIVRADRPCFGVPVAISIGHAEATIAGNNGRHHGFPACVRAAGCHVVHSFSQGWAAFGANAFPPATFRIPARAALLANALMSALAGRSRTGPRKDEQPAVCSYATPAPSEAHRR